MKGGILTISHATVSALFLSESGFCSPEEALRRAFFKSIVRQSRAVTGANASQDEDKSKWTE